jgi:hypothetical protein
MRAGGDVKGVPVPLSVAREAGTTGLHAEQEGVLDLLVPLAERQSQTHTSEQADGSPQMEPHCCLEGFVVACKKACDADGR